MTMQIEIPEDLEEGDLFTVNLEDGRQVQMRVPPGAESGSLVQFEPPPLHEWRGTSLDGEPDPAVSSIELPTANSEDPPEPSEQSEVRLDVNKVEENQENKHESFAHAMMSTHGRDFFDESDYPNGDKDVVDYSLHAGLDFHEFVVTVWCTKDTVFSCDMQTIGPTLWRLIDANGDGFITFNEIEFAMDGEDDETKVQTYLRSVQCPVLNALASRDPKKTRRAFDKMDVASSGHVDFNEWSTFLANVQTERMNYYKSSFLLKDYVYAGLGMEPGTPTCGCCYQGLCTWRGWWEDFVYYVYNSHPLFVVFFEDPLHPYSRSQRITEFVGAFVTTFWGGGVMLLFDDLDFVSKIFVSIIFINLPTAIYRKIVYLFLAAPCLLHDEAAHTDCYNTCCCCCDGLLACCGSLFACAWVLVFLITGIVFWTSWSTTAGLYVWLAGIAQFWVIWFAVALLADFNPSASISKFFAPFNRAVACLSCGLVNTRVGRWHLERHYVHSVIRARVEERGVDMFHLPRGMQKNDVVKIFKVEDEDDLKKQLGLQ